MSEDQYMAYLHGLIDGREVIDAPVGCPYPKPPCTCIEANAQDVNCQWHDWKERGTVRQSLWWYYWRGRRSVTNQLLDKDLPGWKHYCLGWKNPDAKFTFPDDLDKIVPKPQPVATQAQLF